MRSVVANIISFCFRNVWTNRACFGQWREVLESVGQDTEFLEADGAGNEGELLDFAGLGFNHDSVMLVSDSDVKGI